MTLRDDIEKLASETVKAAMAPGIALQERIDALKVLNPIYGHLVKSTDKVSEDDAGGSTFRAWQAGMRESEPHEHGAAVPAIPFSAVRTGSGK